MQRIRRPIRRCLPPQRFLPNVSPLKYRDRFRAILRFAPDPVARNAHRTEAEAIHVKFVANFEAARLGSVERVHMLSWACLRMDRYERYADGLLLWDIAIMLYFK
jgi:hypothetical protein